MSKYLITGGCGFIGSHLAEELLSRGSSVRILDDLSTGKRENLPKEAELLVGSLTDPAILKKGIIDVEGVFHLAAIPSVNESLHRWSSVHEVNLGGSVKLFEALSRLQKKIPIIYASSAGIYGNLDDLPLRETSAAHPLSPYGIDKYAGEHHIHVLWNFFHIPSLSLRFFNVFGPRQDPCSPYAGVISRFLKNAKEGKPLKIYGDGEQTRDFIYVKDVTFFMAEAMKRSWEGALTFNLCSGKGTTVNQLADMISRVTGKPIQKEYAPPREGDVLLSIGDPSALKQFFQLEPRYTLEEGLKACV